MYTVPRQIKRCDVVFMITLWPAEFYRSTLLAFSIDDFHRLNDDEKKQSYYQFLFYFLALHQEAILYISQGKQRHLRYCLYQMSECLDKLNQLEEKNLVIPHEMKAALKEFHDFRQRFGESTESPNTQTESFKEIITYLNNERRFWWGFGRNVWLASVSLALREEVTQTSGMSMIAPMMGLFAWMFFFLRLSAELSEAISESLIRDKRFKGMASAKFFSRFLQQVARRKFILLNDVITGTANALIFFWLRADISATLGAAGGILTMCVLITDIFLALWRYAEARAQFFAKRRAITKRLSELRDLPQPTPQELSEILMLERARQKVESDWHYQQKKLWNIIALVSGLATGFLIMNSFFSSAMFPWLGNTLFMLSGGLIASCSMIVFHMVNLALDRKQLQAQGQLKSAISKLITDVLGPVLFFLSFHFLAVGPAIGALALFLVVSYAAQRLLSERPKVTHAQWSFFSPAAKERPFEERVALLPDESLDYRPT